MSTFNYHDFDLSAFINSPMQTDTAPVAGQLKVVTPSVTIDPSMYDDGVATGHGPQQDYHGPVVDWPSYSEQHSSLSSSFSQGPSSSSTAGLPIEARTQSMSIQGERQPKVATPSPSELEYCSRIAAHHTHQLHLAVPVPPASTPDRPSLGSKNTGSATSLRQLGRRALEPPIPSRPSLQERRRAARRAQHQQQQQQQQMQAPSASASARPTPMPMPTEAVPTASTSTSGINSSGRSHKRGMTTSSGHIHGPKATVHNRKAPQSERPPFQTQVSTAHSIYSEYGPSSQQSTPAVVHKRLPQTPTKPISTAAAASTQAYAASGFDLLGALARVVLRPNPRIILGPIDLSASFTICDARHPEQPIVYCSDTFCNLTGYSRNEILGRNCRFLQSPDGRVRPGSERYHTDNAAVLHLKQHSRAMQECQASLINYRKDGTPFINLVTVVPIPWGQSTEPVYLVGFQVDLVEQPSAVLQRAANGTYVVNYSSGQGVLNKSTTSQFGAPPPAPVRDYEQEAAAQEVSVGKELAEIISGYGHGDTHGAEDQTQWARILLQHSQDLIHVLSLKGTFLYVSPSVERLLGWKPDELIGKSISDFCHPSDVVPVFRELKDSTSNASINAAAKRSFRADGNTNRATKGGVGQGGPEVNLLMRLRHKTNGHIWVESKGKLHLEQGKGRKVVISSGRSRPVYNLPWEPVKATVESDQPAFWAKVSNDGLILSAAEGVEAVIDGTDCSQLYGRHLTQMVNKEAMPALLEALRGVQTATVVHQMFNAIDEPVWVTSTMYPSVGMKGTHTIPTVFVHVALIIPGSESFGSSKRNVVEAKEVCSKGIDANADSDVVPGSSVFGELDTHRPSSHIFELHSLKHANRRLREDVRTAQRRACARQGIETAESMPLVSEAGPMHQHQTTAPLTEGFVKALDEQQQAQEEAQQERGSSSVMATSSQIALSPLAPTTTEPERMSKTLTRPQLAPPRPTIHSSSSSSSSFVVSSSPGERGSSSATSAESDPQRSSKPTFDSSSGSRAGGNSSEETAPTSLPSSAEGDTSEGRSDRDRAMIAKAKAQAHAKSSAMA